MAPRLPAINELVPEIRDVTTALVQAVGNGSLPSTTVSLVYLRAGHVVGNTYQVVRHSADLRRAGAAEDRIASVATWWDSPHFTDAERAALALTDAVLRPNQTSGERVRDELFAEAAKHYDDKALATLTVAVASASYWMAVAMLLKPPSPPA